MENGRVESPRVSRKLQFLRAIQRRAAGSASPEKQDLGYKGDGSARMTDKPLARAVCEPV